MAVSDNRQRHMPLPDDRLPKRCKELAFPEAVLLVNPIEPEFNGEVLACNFCASGGISLTDLPPIF